jgi:hypothetical protein
MQLRGVRVLDPILDDVQIDWIIVPVDACPNEEAERHFSRQHFRVPHEPWGSQRAFVLPVAVRRSRRRVLLLQQSGLIH